VNIGGRISAGCAIAVTHISVILFTSLSINAPYDGQKRTSEHARLMSALRPEADFWRFINFLCATRLQAFSSLQMKSLRVPRQYDARYDTPADEIGY
jgi:hypothetical protein